MGVIIGSLFAILFYGYFLFYVGMGIVHPFGAIYRLIIAERKDSEYAIGLKKYLLNVVFYFLFLFAMTQIDFFEEVFIFNAIYLLVVPWFFGIWYIRHTRTWDKKLQNIKAFDKETLLNVPHKDRLLLDSFPKNKVTFNLPVKRNDRKVKEAIIKKLPKLELAK